MKALRLVLLSSALALAACDPHPAQQQPAPPDEQEIERRVQQRVADARRADAERAAQERDAKLAERERQLAAREQAMQTAPASTPEPEAPESAPRPPDRAEPVETYQVFYDALAPYGGWIELENYGYVWQPRPVLQNPRWRPYTVGHWAHTDYGWTWISSEPWGWATYHYGRWARLRRLGWVWVPGDEWAPAWVSWRYSDRFVGWAPLPPEALFDGARGIRQWADQQFDIATDDYVFVPTGEFGDDELAAVTVAPEQNVSIFSETVNVTNIVETNAVIINNGPVFALVNAKCRKPIAELKVERKEVARNRENRAEEKNGVVVMTAPHIKKTGGVAKPAQAAPQTADVKVNRSPQAPAPPASAMAPPVAARTLQNSATPPPQSQPAATPTPDPRAAVLEQQRRAAVAADRQTQRAAEEETRRARLEAMRAAQEMKRQNRATPPPVPTEQNAPPVGTAPGRQNRVPQGLQKVAPGEASPPATVAPPHKVAPAGRAPASPEASPAR